MAASDKLRFALTIEDDETIIRANLTLTGLTHTRAILHA